MSTQLSRAVLTTLLGLSLSACALDASEADLGAEGAVAQNADALSAVHLHRFSFGAQEIGDQGPAPGADILEAANWVLDAGVDTASLERIKQRGKIPYMYFYIAAGMAKTADHLDDCNVVSFDQSLCKWGGDYISKHVGEVVAAHGHAARAVEKVMNGSPILVHVEPDWYQYTESSHAPGNPGDKTVHPLGLPESGSILNRIVHAIHANCKSCSVVLDVSTWASDLAGYYAHVDLSKVAFVGLVGKTIDATTGKLDNYTFGEVTAITGKRLIVNTAHGPGGGPTPYNTTWDARSSLKSMWNEGVVAVIQSNKSEAHYESTIDHFKHHPVSGP